MAAWLSPKTAGAPRSLLSTEGTVSAFLTLRLGLRRGPGHRDGDDRRPRNCSKRLAQAKCSGTQQSLLGTESAVSASLERETTEACPAVQRWDVKTLRDSLAGDVHFTNVERTTIDKLRHLPDIGAHSHTPRTDPDEFRVFRVRARMVEATIEGDGDIHLVLQNKAFRKIIVEFPDTSCAFNGAAPPPHAEKMRLAREKFEDRCGRPPHGSFMPLKGSATITGGLS